VEKVTVPAAAGRLINAVANMGYDHEVALCDLVDNSIDAQAKTINIHLSKEIKERGRKETINKYLIADDGIGMDKDTLINAFTLGSVRAYPKHALGKFGIGLKSASLSLGNKIVMLTKTAQADKPLCAILSRKHIEEVGNYEIDLGNNPPDQYAQLWEQYAPDQKQGTVLVIEDLNTPPDVDFIDYLRRYSGIIYHLFLEQQRVRTFSIDGKDVEPLDPLFMQEAETNGSLGNPSDWTGETCHLLLAPDSLTLDDGTKCEVAATHLIHPPTFKKQGKQEEMRQHYGIEPDEYTGRPRQGFYIYRNQRVIILAELFRGMVSRETSTWAFRARLMFDESADRVLLLDVRKRHCQLPPTARANLKNLISPVQTKSVKAWKEAGERVGKGNQKSRNTIANQSITKTSVANSDYTPGFSLKTPQEFKEREQRQAEIRLDALTAIQDKAVTEETLETAARQKDVVLPIESLKGNAMWEVYPATTAKLVEIIINQNNSWIAIAYKEAETDARITLLLHQFLTIIGRAELEVRTTHRGSLPEREVDNLFKQFRRCASEIAERLADDLPEEMGKLSVEPKNKEE